MEIPEQCLSPDDIWRLIVICDMCSTSLDPRAANRVPTSVIDDVMFHGFVPSQDDRRFGRLFPVEIRDQFVWRRGVRPSRAAGWCLCDRCFLDLDHFIMGKTGRSIL